MEGLLSVMFNIFNDTQSIPDPVKAKMLC